jgi:hypothetical protein
MSTTRRLSIPAHGALELLVGLALLGLAFGLGLGAAALVVAVAAGAVVAGLGLSGGEGLPLRTHRAADQIVAAALLGCALGLAVAGDHAGAALLGAAAAAEVTLLGATRWTRRPTR